MHRFAFVSLLLVAACAAPAALRAAPAPTLTERAEAAMRPLAEAGFAGSVLVACDDDIVFARDIGVSDPRGREPSYWLASISKQFAAAAILKLAEDGRLSIDDTVGRFFPDASADKSGITLRQLMSHLSGFGQNYAADGIADRDAAARAIPSTPLTQPPGAGFRYSNDNYSLLAMIIEIASGQSFESYLSDHILAPAGLRHTGFWPDVGGDFSPPVLRQLTGPAGNANWGFRGGTGMRASLPDLHRWARALDAGRVLRPESVTLLYGPHTSASDGEGVGFGWFWSGSGDARWLWTRGSEDYGPNVILYRRVGAPLMILAATNAGPAEGTGPGWSRRARDALTPVFDGACAAS